MCGHKYAFGCVIVALTLATTQTTQPVLVEDFESVNEATSGWFRSPYMRLGRGQGMGGGNALRVTLQPSQQGKRVQRRRKTVGVQAQIGWNTTCRCRRDCLNVHCCTTSISKTILRCLLLQ
jgi:hypothetical protein